MNPISQILNKFGIDTVNLIRSNLNSTGTNASGETSSSLQSDMPTPSNVVVSGKPFIYVVETGRKPGKQPPRSKILTWLQSGKVSFEGTADSLSWAISKKIAKEGSKLFRDGGRKDIITPAISEMRITALTNDIADASLGLTVKTIDDFIDGTTNLN